MRCVQKRSVVCAFLIAKCKIAPLNSLSVPRLELLAAVKGTELAVKVSKSLMLDRTKIYFWSDSLDVLAWIKNRNKVFGAFVRDKIGKIRDSSLPERWKYIPSEMNPADLLTRSMKITDLINAEIWGKGPKFLSNLDALDIDFKKDESFSKSFLSTRISGECLEFTQDDLADKFELDDNKAYVLTNFKLDPSFFSSWIRYIRVRTWVIRFLKNCRIPRIDHMERMRGELSSEELLDAKL